MELTTSRGLVLSASHTDSKIYDESAGSLIGTKCEASVHICFEDAGCAGQYRAMLAPEEARQFGYDLIQAAEMATNSERDFLFRQSIKDEK